MISLSVGNIKEFMSMLLKNDTFDRFELRSLKIQTYALFEVDGTLNKAYMTLDEQESITNNYTLWKSIKPFAFDIIKGNKMPSLINIIFSVAKPEKLHANAASMFLNIVYENNSLHIITGSSQKNFSLDKSVDFTWDSWVKKFLSKNGIIVSEN